MGPHTPRKEIGEVVSMVPACPALSPDSGILWPPYWEEWLLDIQEGTGVASPAEKALKMKGWPSVHSEAACSGPGPLRVTSWEVGKRSPRGDEAEISRNNAFPGAWREDWGLASCLPSVPCHHGDLAGVSP